MTIETEEKTLFRPGPGLQQDRHSALLWCRTCRRKVEMVTPEQAAQIAAVSERTIHSWIEASKVHLVEHEGRIWICIAALSRSMPERGTQPSKVAKGQAAG